MTNATKALVITFINAVLAAVPLFGVPLSDPQIAGVGLVVNSGLAVVVALTYKRSTKRIPDDEEF